MMKTYCTYWKFLLIFLDFSIAAFTPLEIDNHPCTPENLKVSIIMYTFHGHYRSKKCILTFVVEIHVSSLNVFLDLSIGSKHLSFHVSIFFIIRLAQKEKISTWKLKMFLANWKVLSVNPRDENYNNLKLPPKKFEYILF